MQQEYDVIVLGTGLKECILSGLMSMEGKTVLHMDRNSFYGGESASLNLNQLFKRFRGEGAEPPASLGRSQFYCIDLCPKFLMASGNLVKVLLHTKVTRYLDFKSVAGSYVFKTDSSLFGSDTSKVHKVPANAQEALSSSLLSLMQKNRYKNFLNFVYNYEDGDAKSQAHGDMKTKTAKNLYDAFSLDEGTQAFTGHAVALFLDDDYLEQPAITLIERVKMYGNSVARYGNSPYIYPMYGLGGLPEGFSRLSAIHGGVYMLNKPIEEILYDDGGKVRGVKSEGEEASCKMLIADPSYFIGTDKIRKTGQVARGIVIMNKPCLNTNSDSAQIIIPARNLSDRKSDLYCTMISWHHKVCAENKFIAVISGHVEGEEAKIGDSKSEEAIAKKNLAGALKLMEQKAIEETFLWVTDSYAPANDSKVDNIFISSTYDATTHFETTATEVLSMYKAITGHDMDLTVVQEEEENNGDGGDGGEKTDE